MELIPAFRNSEYDITPIYIYIFCQWLKFENKISEINSRSCVQNMIKIIVLIVGTNDCVNYWFIDNLD